MEEFRDFAKISRLFRDCIITEKIDGTNAQVYISDDGEIMAGSRNRYITPQADNHGFAKWVEAHKDELLTGLGPGRHFGEWWGSGIQRGYGLKNGEKRFSLFNTSRWTAETTPACCHVVPILYQGSFNTNEVHQVAKLLSLEGSRAAPGYMNPEGVVIYHEASGVMFKYTLDGDGNKWQKGTTVVGGS